MPDKYPAYICWDTYEIVERMLMDNHSEYHRNKTRGVPRDGKALLHGIVYCGECGHKMCVQYKSGTRYLCNHLRQQTGEPVCQYIPADPVDDHVVRLFFEALSEAEIDLAQGVLEETDQQHDRLLRTRRQELDRLRYQAKLAERQYQQTDPDNRLVAAELEQRWELALRELKDAEERLTVEERNSPSWAVPADLLEALKNIGPNLPEIWQQGLFSSVQKKSLLRSLIDKVVIHRAGGHKGDRVHTRVVWHGGATTSQDVLITVGSFAHLQDAAVMEKEILRSAREGKSDEAIATMLTRSGHRSPLRDHVLPSTVKTIRLKHRLLVRESQSHPRHVPGYLTIPQLADQLNISTYWIHDRIRKEVIRVEKDASTKCYLFPDKKNTLRKFRQLFAGKIQDLGF